LSHFQAFQGEGTDADAVDAHGRVADSSHHAADLVVAALIQCQPARSVRGFIFSVSLCLSVCVCVYVCLCVGEQTSRTSQCAVLDPKFRISRASTASFRPAVESRLCARVTHENFSKNSRAAETNQMQNVAALCRRMASWL
jgi:hypothetical protein